MVFNQKNLNQDLDFDSSIYAYENIPMNPTSNTVFPKEQVSFNSVKQIPLNFNISNPQVIINEISSSNPLVQNIYKDISMLASYEESVNFEESSSVNSQIPCRHGEKIKKRKRSTTNSGSKWHWNEEEDRLLIQLVEKHGNKMWNFIAKKMPLGREGKPLEGKQLRDRYNNHLKPGLKKEAWREEEDLKLIEAHENLGNKWVEIAKMLPGRSECDVKNRWNATKRRCLTAIKQRNIPKSNSLFENYVNSILSEKDPNGPISVESNAVVGPEGNVKNNEHVLANGPSTCFDPNELPSENIGQALVGGSNGLPSSDPNNLPNDDDYNILLDLDYLMDMVNGESSINVESDIIVGPEGNGDNKEQALVDGSNGLSTCFNQNNLLGENNEEALAKGSNDLSISSDQNEFPNDDKDSDWGIIEKLIYASDDNDDDDSDNENDDGSGSDGSAE